ncbi:MAG: STAS domain-containing protein [Pseudomonadota bacterium]|nr:STAS domain-containing protein [Pseudomonadota bacterium]
MKVSETLYADAIVVRVEGRIDQASAAEFQKHLTDQVGLAIDGGKQIVVDLSKVDYISSVGLRALMVANKQARPKGVVIRVASMQEVVKEVFTISHFDKVFPTFDEMPKALQAVSALAAAAYGADC